MNSRKKGTIDLEYPKLSEEDSVTHLFSYRLQFLETSNISVVARLEDVTIPYTSVWRSYSLLMRHRKSETVDACLLPTDKRCDSTEKNVPMLRSTLSVDRMTTRQNCAEVFRECVDAILQSSCCSRGEASEPMHLNASTIHWRVPWVESYLYLRYRVIRCASYHTLTLVTPATTLVSALALIRTPPVSAASTFASVSVSTSASA